MSASPLADATLTEQLGDTPFRAGWTTASLGLARDTLERVLPNLRPGRCVIRREVEQRIADIDRTLRLIAVADGKPGEAGVDRPTPRFRDVSCSNCGRSFGPGDYGFSHCDSHAGLRGRS